MIRDFDTLILDIDGKPIPHGTSFDTMRSAMTKAWPLLTQEAKDILNKALEEEAGKPITLGSVSVTSLLHATADDSKLDDRSIMDRMELARRLHLGGKQEISPTERDTIKKLVKKRYPGVMITATAWELLEDEKITKSEPPVPRPDAPNEPKC